MKLLTVSSAVIALFCTVASAQSLRWHDSERDLLWQKHPYSKPGDNRDFPHEWGWDKEWFCGSADEGKSCTSGGCSALSRASGNAYCQAAARNGDVDRGNACWDGECTCQDGGCSMECANCEDIQTDETDPAEVVGPGF